MSLQSLGPVGLRGIIDVISTNVTCFPAMRVVPPALVILGVRHAYQPKSKQQKKDNIVPSHRIGVTQSWDSQHTGKESFLITHPCSCVQLPGFCSLAFENLVITVNY